MFNLSRYFSRLSLAIIVLAALAQGWLFYRISQAQMVGLTEQNNVSMTQVFENTLWPQYGAFLSGLQGDAVLEIRRSSQFDELHRDIQNMMRETSVVKVKVYNLAGVTVYSSDPRQIGEDQSQNAGFLSARDNQPMSGLTHRDTFNDFERTHSNLDVVGSYVPVHGTDHRVVGVIEVYQDVTFALEAIRRNLWWTALASLVVFSLLYAAQYWVVRRAHHILKAQESELSQANQVLDARVMERTYELEAANDYLSQEMAQRKFAEDKLLFLAYHDPITGLTNRRHFAARLAEALTAAGANGSEVAVFSIDVDHFKSINETVGYYAGNDLLTAIATRLQGLLRPADVLSHLADDEFACLMTDLRSVSDAQDLANTLVVALAEPFVVNGNELWVSASVGVSLFPRDGDDAELLLRHAESAMYRAKDMGRNTAYFYEADMSRQASRRLQLHNGMRTALEHRETALMYQPIVSATTGELVGAEALLRWHSASLGGVSPAEFVPLAEDTGYIVALGEWVLASACAQLTRWDATAPKRLPVLSVNVSTRQLERVHVPEWVKRVLRETGLEPHRLDLEVTESALMASETGVATLEQLHQAGVFLSIDDFGTGYSSLAYLKRLPVHKLKIDQAFVRGIGIEPQDESIIRTVVAMAHNLNLRVVAEGVETQAQAQFLAQAGCDALQGYLFARPLTPDEFARQWLS